MGYALSKEQSSYDSDAEYETVDESDAETQEHLRRINACTDKLTMHEKEVGTNQNNTKTQTTQILNEPSGDERPAEKYPLPPQKREVVEGNDNEASSVPEVQQRRAALLAERIEVTTTYPANL